ncbi:cytochrome P450 2J5, partial [Trichonephila inaurata madagascariensis]
FGTENGEKWQEQRKFVLQAARNLGLGKGPWEELIMEETSNFVEEVKKIEGKPVNIVPTLVSSLNASIISLLIGRRLKKDEEADKIELCMDYAHVVFKDVAPSNPMSLVPGLRKLFQILKIAGFDHAAKTIENFNLFMRNEIIRHKNSPDLRTVNDFINSYLDKLSVISKAKDTKNYFSEKTLEGNLGGLFLGASDTISSSLSYLLRLMCKYKEVQDKVYAELIEANGKDGKVRYEDKSKVPYTFAVIMETQRYVSVVRLSGTRTARQDIPVKERFLTDGGTKLIKQPPSYAPFQLGKETVQVKRWLGWAC